MVNRHVPLSRRGPWMCHPHRHPPSRTRHPPAARGAGGITRRVIGKVDCDAARLGVSSLVRASYRYWQLFGELDVQWPAVAVAIEEELGS